ncbi:tetratricopeptide repeat-containing glycosyltransferase family 2 protein [Bacillus sp. FJAT-45350]|uniref:tetratricopeptide repeat-containing glycosyltransferase family 2 protein n=1 Tax=Bacillus sp. FJAT-45350 TaxID=2011014 RepID=UPI000BB8CA1C|nr:TPR domain-containing glycosyltransferase [Bacillus sp. FJAT-45350]
MFKPYDISLCMVVKNEEGWIKQCLSSVKDVVKEMIVVDTGSTDGTRRIAQFMGAQVFNLPWNDDFSEARNFGLNKATCEWILVLDADEEWEQPDEEIFHQLLSAKEVYGYHVKLLNYYGTKKFDGDYVIDSVCRLFRNDSHIRFQGIIHEEVTKSIKERYSSQRILFSNLRIHHYGYLDQVIEKKQKNKRNMELVKKAIEHNPTDLYMQYALGTEYFQEENFQYALNVFEPLLYKIKVTEGYASDLLYKIVYCFKQLKQFYKALDYIKQGISFYPDFVDLLELESLILFELHRYQEAREVLEKCLKIGDVSHLYSTSSGAGTFRTLYLLGMVKERQAEWKQAFEHYLMAVKEEENFTSALSRWANLSFYFYEDDQEWRDHFQKHFTQLTVKNCMVILMQAVFWVRPKIGLTLVEKVSTKDLQLELLKAIFYAQQGSFVKSKKIVVELLSHQQTEQLYLYLWAIHRHLGEKKEAEHILSKLIHLKPDYKGVYHIFVKENRNIKVLETVRTQCIHVLLALQAWEELLVLLVSTNETGSIFLPSHHFPAFQHVPQSVLKELLEQTKGLLREWEYTDLIFLGWSALKTNNHHMSYHIFKQAKRNTDKRIEHTIGALLHLEGSSIETLNVHFDLDCLLLTF